MFTLLIFYFVILADYFLLILAGMVIFQSRGFACWRGCVGVAFVLCNWKV